MSDENKNIENKQEENQNREEYNKKWWKNVGLKPKLKARKKNIKYIIILVIIFCFIILICSIIKLFQNNRIKISFFEQIPNNLTFRKICKSSKSYSKGGGIFYIDDDKYLILGSSNKIEKKYYNFPMPDKRIHLEVFNNKTQKIDIIKDKILYYVLDSVQMTNGNIFFISSDGQEWRRHFFSILDKKTFEVKNIGIFDEFFKEYDRVTIFGLENNKVLIIKNLYEKEEIFVYDGNLNTFSKAPQHNKKGTNYMSAIALDDNRYVLLGGYSTDEDKAKSIEICNIKDNKCVIKKSKLNEIKTSPFLFKVSNNKILIIDSIADHSKTIELYDYEKDIVEIIGEIPNDNVRSRNYIQLKNGDIFISGGFKGISVQEPVNKAYIFHLQNKEINEIESGMIFPRGFHLTSLLKNGNVLICGGNLNNHHKNNYCEELVIK